MTKLAVAALAFVTLTTGCAVMGTKRGQGGAQIQRTKIEEPASPIVNGGLQGNPELGER